MKLRARQILVIPLCINGKGFNTAVMITTPIANQSKDRHKEISIAELAILAKLAILKDDHKSVFTKIRGWTEEN